MPEPAAPAARHDLRRWQHRHDFGTEAERHAERRTRWVVALTFATMLVELAAGWLTGSMALTADGLLTVTDKGVATQRVTDAVSKVTVWATESEYANTSIKEISNKEYNVLFCIIRMLL